jgi:hypothetical protein
MFPKINSIIKIFQKYDPAIHEISTTVENVGPNS